MESGFGTGSTVWLLDWPSIIGPISSYIWGVESFVVVLLVIRLQLLSLQNKSYVFSSSSDGEYSDGEIVLSPLAEVDLPSVSADDSVTTRSLTSRRKEGPANHSKKQRTPTMGGLFFLPVGIFVITAFFSVEVAAAAAATIGLVDDVLCVIKQHSSGLSPHLRLLLEAAVGICFSFWLSATNLSSPYGMKMAVPLPAPLGLVCFGKFLRTAALALIGMSIAVLPICPELAIFGASMAGACVDFFCTTGTKHLYLWVILGPWPLAVH
ncbi:40S ribosomal protein S14-3-like [Hibiscus syriacus]|uniref:40S ribosomal protein S14-3-like n=1 Tax=Hibiscus syriacus TaxID=106335 RepID=A0A6A3BKJ0_HIBSY|nr:40S ribosomal protein S14-3-like [Hibiscus syriacus]